MYIFFSSELGSMSNPSSGFGRGGRGAALAQLLSQQVRRPGDATEGVLHQQPTAFGAAPSQPNGGFSAGLTQQQPLSAGLSPITNGVNGVYTNGTSASYSRPNLSSSTSPVQQSTAVVSPPVTAQMQSEPLTVSSHVLHFHLSDVATISVSRIK